MSVAVRPWRKPGKFQVDIIFRKPDGTRVRDQRVVEAKTKGMARRWGESRENQLRAGSLVLSKPAAPTFSRFVDDDWLPTYPVKAGNRRTTIKEKKTHVRVHLKPFFGETPLDAIDRLMLDQFVAEMFEKTVGKGALRAYEPKREARCPPTFEREEGQERDGYASDNSRHRT